MEDPESDRTLAARVESYRLKGVTPAALSEIQLVAGDPTIVTAAKTAFEVSRRIHYAEDGNDLRSKSNAAENAVHRFVELGAAEIQSVPRVDVGRLIPNASPRQI